MKKKIIKQINKIDIKEIEKRKKGDITSIVVNDVEEVSDFFSNSVSELLYHAVVMVGIVFMMLYISIKLSIISFLTIPIIFIFLNIICCFVVSRSTYFYYNMGISAVESLFFLVTIGMMLFRKDGRGLHDLICKTKVICEE